MYSVSCLPLLFFFNDTATTEIYTLSLHDALPISGGTTVALSSQALRPQSRAAVDPVDRRRPQPRAPGCLRLGNRDRKSTRLNSSHQIISYAVFCLKQKIIRNYSSPHDRSP